MNTDDELFASYVAGERADDDVQMRELFARQPQLRELARELVALREQVDRDARLERDVISLAKRETTAADRARVGEALRAGAGLRRPFVLRRVVTLAAAAAVVLGAALYFRAGDETPKTEHFLSVGGSIALDAPEEPLRAGVALTWAEVERGSERRVELSANERWKLTFEAAVGGASSAKLLLESRCASATWTPRAADLASWPERVLLTIHRVEAGPEGRELSSSPVYSLQVSR
jgi:hypothetical protein